MGPRQTETYYRTEISYLKSVLLWLQEYWTGPPVHIHPLRTVPQGSRHHHGRNCAALNRRDVIIDLPAFLPPKRGSASKRLAPRRLVEASYPPNGRPVQRERIVESQRAQRPEVRSRPGQAGSGTPEISEQIAMRRSCSPGSWACAFGSIRFR
jgi:hypothetical protein